VTSTIVDRAKRAMPYSSISGPLGCLGWGNGKAQKEEDEGQIKVNNMRRRKVPSPHFQDLWVVRVGDGYEQAPK